ncbi:Tripartite motif-containing protein 5 [Tupaia chinensis]|uniref:RING-type E3 ubiquitin transferase n=1 Tax=Tupaia chinensis TaxID=246437 RepID=L8YC17_TUPCH|nr:Tripartite motif-containing protein 5 [Tupaia chinensis]
MALAILVDVKEEVTCPICLELLTEPQSLECGHSFCQSCLIENQTKSTVGQEGENCCPMCRVSYQPGSLRTNRHLANIAERLRKANVSLEEEQRVHHCARHGEKLLLFCKEDGKAICLLCERSQEHRGHQTFLIEEVAQEYQNQLQVDRQNVQAEFTRLRDILDSQEQMMLQKLEKEERDVLQILAESEDEVAQQSQLVSDLISDLEHRLESSAMEMLQVRLQKKP